MRLTLSKIPKSHEECELRARLNNSISTEPAFIIPISLTSSSRKNVEFGVESCKAIGA